MLYIKKDVNIMYIKQWFVHLPVCMFKMNYFSKFTRFIYVCNSRKGYFTQSPKILQFDRVMNYLYSMSRFYQTCEKWFFAFCLIGFLTIFKLLFFVLSFVLHRFWWKNKWDTPWYVPTIYFKISMDTMACPTYWYVDII